MHFQEITASAGTPYYRVVHAQVHTNLYTYTVHLRTSLYTERNDQHRMGRRRSRSCRHLTHDSCRLRFFVGFCGGGIRFLCVKGCRAALSPPIMRPRHCAQTNIYKHINKTHKQDPVVHVPPVLLGFWHAPFEVFYNEEQVCADVGRSVWSFT